MGITRQEFCGALAGASALLILQACGGGDDYGSSPAPAPPPSGCGASGNSIVGNHGHVLTIARVDLDATTPQTYSIAGTSGHDHTVTFSAAQLAQLKAGASVTVTSTPASAGPIHSHDVTAICV